MQQDSHSDRSDDHDCDCDHIGLKDLAEQRRSHDKKGYCDTGGHCIKGVFGNFGDSGDSGDSDDSDDSDDMEGNSDTDAEDTEEEYESEDDESDETMKYKHMESRRACASLGRNRAVRQMAKKHVDVEDDGYAAELEEEYQPKPEKKKLWGSGRRTYSSLAPR